MSQSSIVPKDLAALTNLPDDALINVHQAAAIYACSPRHFWRAADAGLVPPPCRVGRLVRWRLGALREHIRTGCKPCRQGGRAVP